MKDWDDDFDEVPQSSRAGKSKSKTFDGMDNIVDDEDFQADSSSMPKAKKLKKVGAIKKTTARNAPKFVQPKPKKGNQPRENPDEPVRKTWVGVKPRDFKKDRLQFNPY